MKSIVVLLVICVVQNLQANVLPENFSLTLMNNIGTCMVENDVNQDFLGDVWTGYFYLKLWPLEKQKKMDCLCSCVYGKLAALSADGNTLDLQSVNRYNDWSTELKQKCKKQAGNDLCELASCLLLNHRQSQKDIF